MGNLFDTLAKDAAADMPRRQAFRRIGGALLGVVLAAVGLAADSDNCGKACAACCNGRDFPPRSKEHGECMRDCHAGVSSGDPSNPSCGDFVRASGAC